jgi:hypothetical protein
METGYEHITLNEERVPSIAGMTMKVVERVEELRQSKGPSV